MSLQTVKSQAKYGLINKKGPLASSSGSMSKPGLPSKISKAFILDNELEEDEDEAQDTILKTSGRSDIADVNKRLLIASASYRQSSTISDLSNDQNADIYDYDGQYDSFKQMISDKKAAEKTTSLAYNVNWSD